MKILLTALVALILFRATKLAILISKRCRAHSRFKALAKTEKFKLKFTRSLFASLFKISHAPDLVAEIGDKVYLMRYYNGRGRRYQVHFANDEYSVRFQILLIRNLFAASNRNLSGHVKISESTTTIRRKVIIMPKLEVPSEYKSDTDTRQIIPIIIFNPTPSSLTYVSEEKTSIKLAFTGDELHGAKIFTGTSCANFLEREQRYLENKNNL